MIPTPEVEPCSDSGGWAVGALDTTPTPEGGAGRLGRV